MADERRLSVVDDFLLEEHSGESAGDDAASGLEMDDYQAKEIRQIFLTTLPDYLDPVSQMLEQAMSATDGHEQVRRALQTTLSSISAAASRVGINDVCNAVELMRDQLLALEDEPHPASPEFQKTLRDAFAALEAIAGGGRRRVEGGTTQTIVAALQHVEGVDKSVLERLTAAGLVTVDQLRTADPQEVVAVTGLSAVVVGHLLKALLGAPARSGAEMAANQAASVAVVAADTVSLFEAAAELPDMLLAGPPNSEELPRPAPVPSKAGAVPRELTQKLRSQVDIEASLDELRAELLHVRLRIAAHRERLTAAERRRDRLHSQLSKMRKHLAKKLTGLTAARLRQTKLDYERTCKHQALEAATRRLANLRREYQTVVTERAALADAISALADRIAKVNNALHVPEQEHSVGETLTDDAP